MHEAYRASSCRPRPLTPLALPLSRRVLTRVLQALALPSDRQTQVCVHTCVWHPTRLDRAKIPRKQQRERTQERDRKYVYMLGDLAPRVCDRRGLTRERGLTTKQAHAALEASGDLTLCIRGLVVTVHSPCQTGKRSSRAHTSRMARLRSKSRSPFGRRCTKSGPAVCHLAQALVIDDSGWLSTTAMLSSLSRARSHRPQSCL